jgi:hypothetical protein
MQEQDWLPMLVEVGRVAAYAPPVYNPAYQEPEEGKLPLSQIPVDSEALSLAHRRIHRSRGDRFVAANANLRVDGNSRRGPADALRCGK